MPIEGARTQSVAPGLDPLVRRILEARGLVEEQAIASFLDPKLTQLHDPSGLPDMDKAAGRLLRALHARERLVIYGDYDADGLTAAAQLWHICKAIAPDADLATYIPHRIDEGYGVNPASIEQLHAQGARVIVTVDCGVTAHEAAHAARKLGVDLIITDHHTPPATQTSPPDVFALVHPRAPGSTYPFGDLCGAGVAYKLAWRLATLDAGAEHVSQSVRALLLDLLALAAIGTIADVVPLTGENRIITRFGLARLRSTPFTGLNALITASGLDRDNVSADQIGFSLAPRLNACGRLGHARDALELLTSGDEARSTEIATSLNRINEKRRGIERAIFEEAKVMASDAGMTRDDRRAIILAGENWNRGVIGIVCSRLVHLHHRPVILLGQENGVCAGSGRSVEGFDMLEALTDCAAHLTTFGGHPMAAGLAFEHARLDDFIDDFTRIANERLCVDQLVPTLQIDCDASLEELTPMSVGQLEKLGPFGRDNPRPSVRISDLRVTRVDALGAHGRHLKITVQQDRRELRLIAWRWGAHRQDLPRGSRIDVVVTPALNHWNGRTSVEPELRDLREQAPG